MFAICEAPTIARSLQEGFGCSLQRAATVADEIALLAEGRVRAVGSPAEVLTTDLLSDAYGIRVEIDHDPVTGALRTRPIGRPPPRKALR